MILENYKSILMTMKVLSNFFLSKHYSLHDHSGEIVAFSHVILLQVILKNSFLYTHKIVFGNYVQQQETVYIPNTYILFFSLSGMRNLCVSCSLVCLILLSSSFLVFMVGFAQKQVPPIVIVSVLYILAGKNVILQEFIK